MSLEHGVEPMQEQLPHRGIILEQSVPGGLFPMGSTHPATIFKGCSPWTGPTLKQGVQSVSCERHAVLEVEKGVRRREWQKL